MTESQRQLKEKHGTPEKFEKAVWVAYCDLWITESEALSGIARYKREWLEAGHDVHVYAES